VKNDKKFRDLLNSWNQKLKDSGFKDIEGWSTSGRQHTFGFLDNIGRNNERDQHINKEEKFRMIGIYAYHYPGLSETMREVLALYSNSVSLRKAVTMVNPPMNYATVKSHLHKRHDKIMEFVRQLDEESNND
jgi:hypothetical protein